MSFNPERPYDDLPFLWPDEKKWKTIAVLEKLNSANKSLAELKGHLAAIPNPGIFITTLTLQEAKDSSAIENVVTTNDKLFRAYTSQKTADPQTREVLRYGKALTEAYKKIKDASFLTIPFIENIYRIIKDAKDGIRESDVYVGNAFQVIYTPPSGKEAVEKILKNWIKCATESSSMDPLIKMSILHYQFEAIHPFNDGNGRTGRVINGLYLCREGLLNEPVLYLSKYINSYKNDYYNYLQKVTEKQDWESWIIYILAAVDETSKYTLKKVLSMLDLFRKCREIINEKAPDVYSHELLEVLFTRVYCKYAFLEERKIANRNTASKYLNILVDLKILEKEKIGNEFIFKNIALYDLFRND